MSLAHRLLAPYREGVVGIDPRARRLMIASFLFVGARMSVATFLGIYLRDTAGIALSFVGLAFLLENVARGLVAPLAGALSDRIGRRPVLLGSAFATALVLPGFLLVDSVMGLFAWSLLLGLAQGPYFPSVAALLMDLSPVDRRQATLSVNYTAISLGYTIAVAPAGFLAERSFVLLAGLSSLLFLSIGILLAVGLRGPLPLPEGSTRSVGANAILAARDPVFLAFALPAMLFPLGIGLVSLAIPVYAEDHGITESTTGLALSATGILLAVLSIPLNARSGVRGPFRLLPLSGLLAALAYAAFAWSPGVPFLLLGLTVFTVGEVLFSAALPTAVAALAPPGSRGAYQGAWAFVFSSSLGAAFLLTGLLAEAHGWRATWAVYAVATLAASVLLLALRAWFRRHADARAAGQA